MQAGDDRHIPSLGDRGATELYTRDRNGNILSGPHFFHDARSGGDGARCTGDRWGILDVAGSLVVEYKHDARGKPTLVRTLTTAYKAMAKLDPLSIVGVHDEGTGSSSPGSRFYDPLAIIYRGKLRSPEAFAPGVPIEVVKYVWKRQGTLAPCTIESCVFMNVPMFQREEKKMKLQKSIFDYLEDLDVSESSHETQEEAVRILTSYVATSIPSIQFLIRPFAWKDVWDNAARIIVAQTDAALERYIPQLLIWLTDINWPGADLIFKRLIQFSGEKLEAWIDDAKRWAKMDGNLYWEESLEDLRTKRAAKKD